MEINYEYNNVAASKRLESIVEDKLNKIYDKYDFIVRADVFFKTENTSSEDTGMICGIRLSVPGPRLFAESSNKNFETSISETYDELERQLRKKKGKMKNY